MKEYLQRLALKIDAMSLRERAMGFAIAALVLVTLVDTFMLDSLLSVQKQRAHKIKLDQQQIAMMHAEIKTIVSGHNFDPDAANKARLQALKQQSEKLRTDLAGIQQSLVAPDRMATLLEDLLNKNGRLQLVSLKTLPVTLLSESAPAPGKAAGDAQPATAVSAGRQEPRKPDAHAESELVYKHSVELTVLGSYADMANYLSQLENMPWRLFWAKAKLDVDEYPKVRLTLTLFTLSLDKTWLNI